MPEILSEFVDKLVAEFPNILTALLIFFGSLYLARLLSDLLKKVLERRGADHEVTLLLGTIMRWSVVVAGVMTALQRFFDVTAFLAGLGILGFTIGFALQNIMQNFVSGVILLIEQPFDVGDAVELNSYGGTVLTINLRTTEMRTFDGLIVMIPNADVLSNTITNYTRDDIHRKLSLWDELRRDILENAAIAESLQKAVADMNFVAAATQRERAFHLPYYTRRL